MSAGSGGARILHWLRRAALCLTIAYVGSFFLLLAMLMWWGERHWLLSLLLFAPPQIFLLPLIALTPMCLALRPRLVLVHLACVLVLAFGYMTFGWHPRPSPEAKPLVVITHNIGQSSRQQLLSFIAAEQPDIIALQDAAVGGPAFSKLFPDRYVSVRGEFLLISRDIIRRAELLEHPRWGKRAVAARFEILRAGRPFVIYDVHLPTPRNQFNRFLSHRIITDFIGDEEHAPGFASYREWLDARIQLSRDLSAVFAAEPHPFIACGDFNTPDHGHIYRILSRGLTDSHTAAGRGWGLTFPGHSSRALALYGPWLRIDYAFAGHGWRPIYSTPDPGRTSQHCALVARFIPTDP